MHRIQIGLARRRLITFSVLAFSAMVAGCGWVDSGVGGNDPPSVTGVQADYTVVAGTTLAVAPADGVLKDVQDGGNSPPTARLTAGPQHAAAFSLASDGSFSYTHDGGTAASDSFTFVANDGIADSAPATATIRIDQPPVAADDAFDADAGQSLQVAAKDGVLRNDTDLNTDDTLTAKLENPPATGQVQLAADGGFVYTPEAGKAQRESFTYRANDGNADSAPATVTIRIRPQAADDSAQTISGQPTTISVLANDNDPDGSLDPKGIAIVQAPGHGHAVAADNGTVTYTPAAGFSGTDRFDYTVTDNDGATSNAASVTVSVLANLPPLAVDDTASVRIGSAVKIDVLANDSDPDGKLAPASVRIASPPAAGTTVVEKDGQITYTPATAGTLTFTYTVADNAGASSNPATVTVTVTANAPPVALDDSAVTRFGGQVTIGVLHNDSDPDGSLDKASVSLVSNPVAGTASVAGDGKITYTAVAAGTYTFQYTVADNDGARSNAATVTVVVSSNLSPLANADSAETSQDTAVTIAVLDNDSDPDGKLDKGSVLIDSPPDNGAATVKGDGKVDYQPVAGFVGSDAFSYTVADNDGARSAPAAVSIVVASSRD